MRTATLWLLLATILGLVLEMGFQLRINQNQIEINKAQMTINKRLLDRVEYLERR